VEALRKQAHAARSRADTALRTAQRAAEAAATARDRADGTSRAAAEESAVDARTLAVARTVRTVHNTTNERYVRGLVEQAGAAVDGDERAILLLAALRGLHDLDRMFKR
jgi:hypothetical protein